MLATPYYMIAILAAWAILAATFIGWGCALVRIAGVPAEKPRDLFLLFWMGWACAVGFLQFWHLRFPVDANALAIVLLVGMIGLLASARPWYAVCTRRIVPFLKRRLTIVGACVLIAIVWSNLALGLPRHHDTGLYHLQAVRWCSEYPVAPGLVHLHSRLAYNNSVFLYAAMLDVGPGPNQSHHLAGGLLCVAALCQAILAARRVFRRGRRGWAAGAIAMVMIPVLILYSYKEATSYSPDLAIFLVQTALTLVLVELWESVAAQPGRRYFLLLGICVLSAAGLTVKLNCALFGVASVCVGCLLAIAVPAIRKRRATRQGRRINLQEPSVSRCESVNLSYDGLPRPSIEQHAGPRRPWKAIVQRIQQSERKLPSFGWIRPATTAAVCCVLIGAGWAARGIYLSGYPAYPLTIGAADVPWRISKEAADYERMLIKGWSRRGDENWAEALESNAWIAHWFLAQFSRPIKVLVPVLLTLAGLIAFGVNRSKRTFSTKFTGVFVLIAAPPVVTIAVVLVQSPDFRFAGASLWILAATATTFSMAELRRGSAEFQFRFRGAVTLTLILTSIVGIKASRYFQFVADGHGLRPIPQVEYETMVTTHGVEVHIPNPPQELAAWDAPLPCAVQFNPHLQLQDPGRLASGFTVPLPERAAGVGSRTY